MIYSRDRDTADRIVELLRVAPRSIKSLRTELETSDEVSLRGVYKAITKLVSAGVVLKVGKRVMIDEEWAGRVGRELGSATPISLSLNERGAFSFTSVANLDAFWKTIALPLEKSSGVKELFFYNPHNFWAYLPDRNQSEDAYYRHFSESGRHGFFTVGGIAPADKTFKRAYQDDHLQVNTEEIRSFKRTDHVTLIGPYVITVRLSKSVAARIDALYDSGRAAEAFLLELLSICAKPGKIRFIIENSPAKASKLRRSLSKNFYFKLDKTA